MKHNQKGTLVQEQKHKTQPIRIDTALLKEIERIGISKSQERGKLLTIAETVDELLKEGIKNFDQGA